MAKDQEITSDLGNQWISEVISKVRESHPSTDSNVFAVFERLLQNEFSDRDLTSANLKQVAITLADSFVLKKTDPEAIDED